MSLKINPTLQIRQIPPDVVSKIAAGEVVEGVYSVVKELVENSLDAGATIISINFEDFGLGSIKVIDNGCGLDEQNLKKCYLNHYSSKLHKFSDLTSLNTFGFRGEALSSIAQVSLMTIKSRTHDAPQGYVLTISKGKLLSCLPVGCSEGTAVEVSNLFFSVPARKKFLKNKELELRKALEYLENVILSKPECGFSISHNGKRIYSPIRSKKNTGNKNTEWLLERIEDVKGLSLSENLLELSISDSKVKVWGYIGNPQSASSNPLLHTIFVNGRSISNSKISKVVNDSYKNLIDPRTKVPFIFFVELSPSLVDVNIHPRKEEVRFWDEKLILNLLKLGIEKTLKSNNLTYIYGDRAFSYRVPVKGTYEILKDSKLPWDPGISKHASLPIQVFDTFIIFSSKFGLEVIDQHAAHESILYEDYLTEFQSKRNKTTILDKPENLVLPKSFLAIFDRYESFLSDLGFDISKDVSTSKNNFRIYAIPSILKGHSIASFLLDILEDFDTYGNSSGLDARLQRTVATLACRTAIKAGDKLTRFQIQNLISKLDANKLIYTCPHGRPVRIIIGKNMFEKWFKR